MISSDKPSNDTRQVVETIIEQLTVLPESEILLRLRINAEVNSGLDRNKIRTLIENSITLRFLDKKNK